MKKYREEKDTMGIVRVPLTAYYGAQTQRAADNFPISNRKLPFTFIRALALIKQCAARVNRELDLLDGERAEAIVQAAREVMEGRFNDQFVVDVFQTGSGTSTNMNVNEVLASRANEILTGKRGGKNPLHPNDHVNLGQSSNDVIPSTLHIAALGSIRNLLTPGLARLHRSLSQKADEFSGVEKLGRTHLQDAVPMTLGQEFSGFARQIELGIQRIGAVEESLSELALGGTAVGTGENAHPEFGPKVIFLIAEQTNIPFRQAKNHFEAQAARDAAVETSGALKTIAVSLTKIANDIRWLASGPRCGIGEINIPPLQPGSSIMPGKVNPVIAEVVLQVAAQVMGNDTAIMIGGQAGNFELNVMIPLIAHNLLESIEILAAAADVFAAKCIDGISANRQICAANIEKSLALATRLVPHIGYDRAAAVAKKAGETRKTVVEIVRAEKLLSEEALQKIITGERKQRGM
ncbi:MAG: class II fumarate hydratase [Desulfobacterales bacterium]|nr:class II fumarate hydratase [Desulfobacterales bacterium]